jgi:Flp pilus assembly protein TadG
VTRLARVPRLLPRRRRPAGATCLSAHRSGQAIVEFAGAMTVLLLLALGIMTFAPAVVRTAQLTQAVRDGVAYGRMAPNDAAGIRDRVRRSAPSMGIPDSAISITCRQGLDWTTPVVPCASAVPGNSIRVEATFVFQMINSPLATRLNAPLEITRSAVSEIY